MMFSGFTSIAERYALAEFICENPGYSRKILNAKLGFELVKEHLDTLKRSGQIQYNRKTKGYHCTGHHVGAKYGVVHL